jgi:hypothetical protein
MATEGSKGVMRILLFVFILIVYMSSNVHAGQSLAGLKADKFYSACSADKAQLEFALCMTYIGGWLEGVMAQRLHTTFMRLKSGSNGPMPPWAKTRAFHCLDLKTSEEELAKKYVAWYNSKMATLRESDYKDFKKKGAGTAIANMMREIYFCKFKK